MLTNFANKLSKRPYLSTITASATIISILTSIPVSALAAGFTGPFDPSNFVLSNTNADGSVDTANAPTSITLIGGDNRSNSVGTTDWTINIDSTRAGTISFDWMYSSLDTPGDDEAGYLLNSNFFTLATQDGDSSTSPVVLAVNNGDVFGFRVATASNTGGPGEFTVNNFDAQPVPFEFSPTLGLVVLGGLHFYRQRCRNQKQLSKTK